MLAKHKMNPETKAVLLKPADPNLYPDFVGRDEYRPSEIPMFSKYGDNAWYPRNMQSAINKMRRNFHKYDMIIEIHDARIPFTGRNPLFYSYLRGKPYVLLLNKTDLCPLDYKQQQEMRKRLLFQEPGLTDVQFVSIEPTLVRDAKENLRQEKFGKDFLNRLINEWCTNTVMRLHREEASNFHALIVGLPNTGKSSFLNLMRRAGYSEAGLQRKQEVDAKRPGEKFQPGSTYKIQEKVKVKDNPLIYMTDTPGIFHSKLPSLEAAVKLATTRIVHQARVTYIGTADYILFELNRQRNFKYVETLNLDGPIDDIQKILSKIAYDNNLTRSQRVLTGTGHRQVRLINFDNAAQMFIRAYEANLFDRIFFDQDVLDKELLARQGSLLNYKISEAREGETVHQIYDNENEVPMQLKSNKGSIPNLVLELPE